MDKHSPNHARNEHKGTKNYPVDRNFTPSDNRKNPGSPDHDPANRPYKKPYADHHNGRYVRDDRYDRDDRNDRNGHQGKEFRNDRNPQNDRDFRHDDRESPEKDMERDDLVIGRNAVRELLRSGRTVDKLLVRRGDREGSIVMLVAEAVDRGIPVVEVDKAKLDSLADFVPHQGIIAMTAVKEYCTVEDILASAAEKGEKPFLVIADGITDPYNLGALIRCAEGVGAHGIVIPRRRAVGLTALVAKSSAGAVEHIPVAKVSNIQNTVRALQKAGIWVYAAEAGGKPYYETDFSGPCAIVMGSEGDGVSRVVKDICDGIVSIPMYGKVNSFNVSTAASVILCEVARRRHS